MAAITNHNFFEKLYFQSYEAACKAVSIVLLPGVELDVVLLEGPSQRGHCIVIANPNELDKFAQKMASLGLDNPSAADSFKITIADLVSILKDINCFLIVHYGGKAQAFQPDDINYLKRNMVGKAIFVEPSNLLSAFVYIAHGSPSLIGSDCLDWSKYPGENKQLPELKFPVSSFDTFLMLLRKNPTVIQTTLDHSKPPEIVSFTDETYHDLSLSIPLYNDINVIFGGKSTGKSIIVKDLSNYFHDHQKTTSFYAASDKDSDYENATTFNPSGEQRALAESPLLKDDFDFFSKEQTVNPPKIFDQLTEYSKTKNGDLRKRLGFVNSTTIFQSNPDEYEKTVQNLKTKITKLDSFHAADFERFISQADYLTLKDLLEKIKTGINSEYQARYIEHYSAIYANKGIQHFKEAFTKEKGLPTKPNSIGLLELYNHFKSCYIHSKAIFDGLNSSLIPDKKKIGNLDNKGDIFLKGEFGINPDLFKRGFRIASKKPLSVLRQAKQNVETMMNACYSPNCESCFSSLSSFFLDNAIDANSFFGSFSSLVNQSDLLIEPSNGEKSVLVLGSKLFDNKDVYLLDEPEMSVGHDYVNRVIITRLKELARKGKMVIVSTHDANIAVRTLPCCVIYRQETSSNTYNTFIGNPFIGILKDSVGTEISWRDKTLEILEGGEEAFDERTIDYGK